MKTLFGWAGSAGLQLLILVLILGVDSLASHDFFAVHIQDGRLFGSVIDVAYHATPVILLGIGMSLVIATRGIDLSVGAVMAISGAAAAVLVNDGVPPMLAIGAALAAGVGCGLWNGCVVVLLGIQPIVATLILMFAGRGIAQLITGGQIVTFDEPALVAISSGSVLAVPLPIVIAGAVLLITQQLVRRTAIGLFIESTGANDRASHLAGVATRTVTIGAYVVSGLCAAMAGLIAASDIRGADGNNAGLWLELDAVLAVVLGGASLLGGRFSLVRTALGGLIIQGMNTGILLSGVQPEFNLILKAVVVLVILLLQSPILDGAMLRLRARWLA